MTIDDLLDEQARVRPNAVALVDERADRKLTFAKLQESVAASAGQWHAHGIRRGDAVLVFVPMSADLYIALLGLFRLGAVALFLDPSAGQAHLENCCACWEPRAFLAIPKAHLLRLRSAALRKIPLKLSVGGWLPFTRRWKVKAGASPLVLPAIEPSEAAIVTFTSGSTGLPKAAVRTHEFLLAQYRAIAPNFHLQPGDVDLATLPIFVLANLAAGVTTVLPEMDLRNPGKADAARIFGQIERFQVTRITASPALLERLVDYGLTHKRMLSGMKHIHTGGAPVFPRLLDALARLAPNAAIVAVYGSTEAEPIAHLDRIQISTTDLAAMTGGKGLLAGRPIAGVKLAILPDAFGKTRSPMSPDAFDLAKLAPGGTGEIVVSGDHVLKGYLGGRGDEETKFKVGGEIWHRTGDAGMWDSEGRIWLLGRCSARIDDEQGRLYPFGVECIAMTFPTVRRAAMTSHHAKRVLVVEAEETVLLRENLTAAVAPYQVDTLLFIFQLPVDRRHNAKIDYPELHRLLEERTAKV